MHISLIGMSNSGKTYWSQKLETAGFKRYSSDDYIEEKLGEELKKLGYSGIADVSKWLGQPYEESHARNSKTYLSYEIESLQYFISQITNQDDNVVIDTTGSVIYTGDVLKKLKKSTKIVYLDTPAKVQKQMYESYIKNPKPVLWQGSFYKLKGESDMEALSRCYPEFLRYRTTKYRSLANITFDYHLLRDKDLTTENFISLLQSRLTKPNKIPL